MVAHPDARQKNVLDLQTLEARPVFVGDEIQDLQADEHNRAKEIIEDRRPV